MHRMSIRTLAILPCFGFLLGVAESAFAQDAPVELGVIAPPQWAQRMASVTSSGTRRR
jgi:hypothetical protein